MAAGLQILARNFAREFVGEIEYEKAELIPRFNAVGSWSLDIGFDGNLNTPNGQLLLPGAGIAAVVGSQIVFSGPVTKPARIRNGDEHQLTIAGADDLILLEDGVAHQNPANADTPQGDNTYAAGSDNRAANAETVIKQYVSFNVGPSAIVSRRRAGLTIGTDQFRGIAVEESARMQNLLELVVKLANVGGLGITCRQTATGTITFDVFVPADKTDHVVFAVEVGNTNGYEYSAERPTANLVYVGGSGTGASRLFKIVSDPVSIAAWGRVETFLNESSTSLTKLTQAGNGELLTKAARHFFSATTIDTGQHQWTPLAPAGASVETYNLGDRVRAIADGTEIFEVIRELHVVHDRDGLRVSPTIGSADQGGRPEEKFFQQLVQTIRTMRLQIRDLQRG